MSPRSPRLLSLLSAALISISTVTASPPYPYKRANTGTAVYPTGTNIHPTGTNLHTTCTSLPTYHPPSFTPSTSTAPPTHTSSTTPPTSTPTTFKLRVSAAYGYENPPPPPPGYAYLYPGPRNGFASTADASLAAIFTLNADGTLSSSDLIANMPPEVAYHQIWFEDEANIVSEGLFKTTCTIDGGLLHCSTTTGSAGFFTNDVLFACASEAPFALVYGPTGRPYNSGCFSLNLEVLPI